jgi:pyridinium-3,5-bisthiocarboxylic acid mononucleotide nickel chelatase
MSIIYFDCFSGASGDMILGALIDAGASEDLVRSNLHSLGLSGWRLEVTTQSGGFLRAVRAEVTLTANEPHRSYRNVRTILESADLSEWTRERSLAVFGRLAEAEARVHGVPVDAVVFHEVGAADALIDVVGSCSAIEHFKPTLVACGPIATGMGTVLTDHGELPLPAPAVAELLRGVPIFGRGRRELVTPTGAALLATLCDVFGQLPPMTLLATGYGAGARAAKTGPPNVLRVLIGADADEGAERAVLIETNIDDLSPELFPHVIEQLIEAGAHDAWTTPIVMKKGRMATTLSVLCDEAGRGKLMDIVFAETTTLGLRVIPVAKHALARETIEVEAARHTVRVKIGRRADVIVTIAPEYEDARAAARATGRPLKEIYALATEAAHKATSGSQ